MEMKKVIIRGSSGDNGETYKITKKLSEIYNWDVINLNDYKISYFDYEYKNENDDYLELMESITEKYDVIIFATPVYWYSMSGIMKVFFDRFTDLLTIRKEIGRKLKTKKMAVITSSIGNNLGEQFWLPFSNTAEYLGMEYLGGLHTNSKMNNDIQIEKFANEIEQKTAYNKV